MKRMTSLWIQVQAQVSNEDVVAAEAKRDGGLGRLEKKEERNMGPLGSLSDSSKASLLPSTRPKPLAFFRSAAIIVHSLTNGTTGTGSVITGCRITREKLEEKKN